VSLNQYSGRIAARTLETLFAAALLITVPARGQVSPTAQSPVPPRAISLDEAVRTAEAQSEAIRIARAGVQRAEGQQYQARSLRLPQLGASASYTRTLASQFSSAGGSPAVDATKPTPPPAPCDQYLLDATATTAERLAGLEDASRCALGNNPFSSFGSLGFGAKNQYNAGLSFSQNLFAGGRISAQNAVANAGRRSADIELAAQRAQLRLDVTQAYFDAALADRLVALAESSAVQTDKVLRQTQLARTVGNVSEFELLRAQVSSANQRPIVIQRQSDREVAYLRLKQLLNLPLDSPVQADPDAVLEALLGGRSNRRQRAPRALERAQYEFEIVANFAAYRDLHRHRMLTQDRQLLGTALGYDLPPALTELGMDKAFRRAVDRATAAHRRMEADIGPALAQYVVPLAFRVRWFFRVNLRELYHLCELRTTPQGHPDYRVVAQEMFRLASEVHPRLTRYAAFVDTGPGDELERRRSERRRDEKLRTLGGPVL